MEIRLASDPPRWDTTPSAKHFLRYNSVKYWNTYKGGFMQGGIQIDLPNPGSGADNFSNASLQIEDLDLEEAK